MTASLTTVFVSYVLLLSSNAIHAYDGEMQADCSLAIRGRLELCQNKMFIDFGEEELENATISLCKILATDVEVVRRLRIDVNISMLIDRQNLSECFNQACTGDICNTTNDESHNVAKCNLISIIVYSLLGLTTMFLIVTLTLLIWFIRKTRQLRKKVEQYARSHSRLNKHNKEEHTLHNPVYCDTVLKKPQEKEHGVCVTNPHKEGQYSLAGPGMPYEICDTDDF